MTVLSSRSMRVAAGVTVVGAVMWQTGVAPFVTGLRSLDASTLVLGAALAVPATVACAWRWHLVARRLGVGVGLGPAVASYYRSQFLNTALPGGILGDVHRGLHHGREVGDTGRGLRAVAWERLAGQVVLAVLALLVLLLLPSPVHRSVPVVLGAVVVGFVAAALLARHVPQTRPTSPLRRMLRAVRDDVQCGLMVRRIWPGVVLASTTAVALHLSTYVVAARAVGATTSLVTLVPVALLVLVAAGLPLNVAGWGPREGMAAWSFGAAGLGVEQGVATAVAYGAIVLVANLPGAVVLGVAAWRRGRVHSIGPSSWVPHRVAGQGWHHG
ncbi:MAG: lysylphosphatidylglycerol synthase transmembrane domain-containing protein [Nocardioidaceae bacterium]